MWDIKTIIKDYLRTKSFQEFINNRFKDKSFLQISLKTNVFKYIETDTTKFYFDNMIPSIEQVNIDYNFDDIRPDDIVLDVGSCIGAFSLKVAKQVQHVYAVEPVFADRIRKNISLNKIDNISVLEYGLGEGDLNIVYEGESKQAKCVSLSEIINLCGGHIDFLKCDCEGGEWSISPTELKNIRRIEMEVHNLDGKHNFNDYLKMLNAAGFTYTKNVYNETVMIVHARKEL